MSGTGSAADLMALPAQLPHLRRQQGQPGVRQQPWQVAPARGSVMPCPAEQRPHHCLLIRHVDVVRRQQPLDITGEQQQELWVDGHLQEVFLTGGRASLRGGGNLLGGGWLAPHSLAE